MCKEFFYKLEIITAKKLEIVRRLQRNYDRKEIGDWKLELLETSLNAIIHVIVRGIASDKLKRSHLDHGLSR